MCNFAQDTKKSLNDATIGSMLLSRYFDNGCGRFSGVVNLKWFAIQNTFIYPLWSYYITHHVEIMIK
jgi:hypothetical protein